MAANYSVLDITTDIAVGYHDNLNISNYLPVLCYDGKIGRSVVCASALTVQPPAETAVRPQLQPQQWGDNKQSVEPSQGVLTLLSLLTPQHHTMVKSHPH